MLRPTWFSSLLPGEVIRRHLYYNGNKEEKNFFVLDRAEFSKSYYDFYPLVKACQGFLLTSEYVVAATPFRNCDPEDRISVCTINLTPTNTGDWHWTCTCMKDLLPGIVPLNPLDIWDIVINYLYATNIEPHKVFADSTKRLWMPLSSLKGDGPGQDVQGLQGACGATGAQGVQGNQRNLGAPGPQGAMGITRPQGTPGCTKLLWTSKLPLLGCNKNVEIPWKQYLAIDKQKRVDLCEVQLVQLV